MELIELPRGGNSSRVQGMHCAFGRLLKVVALDVETNIVDVVQKLGVRVISHHVSAKCLCAGLDIILRAVNHQAIKPGVQVVAIGQPVEEEKRKRMVSFEEVVQVGFFV